jgi:purine-nucleoside phosphorylase
VNALIERNRRLAAAVKTATDGLKASLKWDSLASKPKSAVVLGSGLGAFADALSERLTVPFSAVPGLPASAVPGHAGQWVVGKTAGNVTVVAQQGRIHAYEGHDLATVTLPVRVLAELGIKRLLLTNAAGSVNPSYRPGDFVLVDDHINFAAWSPLTGVFNEELGQRFVDMSEPYELAMNNVLAETAAQKRPDIKIHRGVYCGVRGPQYETPAEIRMIGKLGGDVVGMSTVPETIVARQCGMNVNGISCVTNFGSGVKPGVLSHKDVAEMGRKSSPQFSWLVDAWFGLAN